MSATDAPASTPRMRRASAVSMAATGCRATARGPVFREAPANHRPTTPSTIATGQSPRTPTNAAPVKAASAAAALAIRQSRPFSSGRPRLTQR